MNATMVLLTLMIGGLAAATSPTPDHGLFAGNSTVPSCRYLQSDAGWPSPETWHSLNTSLGGRLIASVPLASPCHGQGYDRAECTALAQAWAYPQTHFNSSCSIVAPYFQNGSCTPFTPKSKQCTLGNLVSYAINVSTAKDVAHGLAFASAHNVRVVVKNTGHDFLGRSTGASGLGFWTHNLKSIGYLQYRSLHYSGPAMRFGAGVQAWEAYDAAFSHGVRIVGPTCPTVGIAGGYSQGGGHGMLSSINGLSADNVLEWEFVTVDGRHLVATPSQEPGLFWALSGGGAASNLGVVLSVTLRAFPDGPLGGASILLTSTKVSQDQYWNAVGQWFATIPDIVDNGGTTGFLVNSKLLEIQHVTLPNRSTSDVKSLLEPFTGGLRAQNISFQMNVTSLPNFLAQTKHYIGLPYGDDPSNQVTGSRLVPRSVIKGNNTALTAAVRNICENPRFTVLGVGLDVSRQTPVSNAVLPAWRQTNAHFIVTGYWNYTEPFKSNAQTQQDLTDEQVARLETLTPGSGSYMNEGNFQQPDWQQTFFGSNYDRLLSIKHLYDPDGLLYVTRGVGSEAWVAEPDGRLCRKY